MSKDLIHSGQRSWWNGDVKTLCGLRIPSKKEQKQGWFASVTCPACKRAEKKGSRK